MLGGDLSRGIALLRYPRYYGIRAFSGRNTIGGSAAVDSRVEFTL